MQPAVIDDPEKLLEEAMKVVQKESFQMKRSLVSLWAHEE